jgi:hypothetical protein
MKHFICDQQTFAGSIDLFKGQAHYTACGDGTNDVVLIADFHDGMDEAKFRAKAGVRRLVDAMKKVPKEHADKLKDKYGVEQGDDEQTAVNKLAASFPALQHFLD